MTNETISAYLARVEDAQIAQVNPFAGYSLSELLGMWNESTAPNVPRTNAEHSECATVAHEAKSELNRRFIYGRDYKELGNGALWPISR